MTFCASCDSSAAKIGDTTLGHASVPLLTLIEMEDWTCLPGRSPEAKAGPAEKVKAMCHKDRFEPSPLNLLKFYDTYHKTFKCESASSQR